MPVDYGHEGAVHGQHVPAGELFRLPLINLHRSKLLLVAGRVVCGGWGGVLGGDVVDTWGLLFVGWVGLGGGGYKGRARSAR